MSCKTLCPFRTIPEDVQLAIYGKMCQTELKEIAKTCVVAEEFIKKNFFGTLKLEQEDNVQIIAKKDGISVFVTGPSSKGKSMVIDIEAYSTIAPISINHLTIAIRDNTKAFTVMHTVNKLRPACRSASISGAIPSFILKDWMEFMKCPEGLYFDCHSKAENGEDIIDNLRQIQNPEKCDMRFNESNDYDGLLEDARVFRKVEVETNEARINKFVYEVLNGKDLGNLEEITLSTSFDRYIGFESLIPGATRLYKNPRKCKYMFSKLPLEDDKCLFVEETVMDGRMFAFCKLMRNDEVVILDLVLDKISVLLSD